MVTLPTSPALGAKGILLAEVIHLDRLSQPVILVSGVVFVGMLWGIAVGESPLLTIAGGLVTILAVMLLWRSGEPPTLLLMAGIHLLQVTTALVYANVLGVHINTLSDYGVDLENATLVALGGVLCLVLGMSLGDAGPSIWSPAVAQAEARNWSPRSAFRFFLVTLGIGSFFGYLSTLSESVRQLFLAGSGIQWIGIYLLSYVCLSLKRGFSYLLIASGIEVAIGFTGYFGDFRVLFFVLFVAFASARPKLKFSSVVAITVTAAIALVLSAFWSAVKVDYRKFLNNGSNAQVVLVPLEDRFAFLYDRVSEADAETMERGFDLLVRRISYVDYFGATMNFVPTGRPHENGRMIMAAISHILLPRMFDSDKAVLPNDTAVTLAYTGLPMGLAPGVSISIGYPGEFYIDFGVIGMMACMSILGFLYGKGNRYLQQHFDSALVSYGATVVFLMPGLYFETSLPKTVGGVCTSFLVLILVSKVVLPFALNALAWKEQRAAPSPNGASIGKIGLPLF
jgi:hypothetical protein